VSELLAYFLARMAEPVHVPCHSQQSNGKWGGIVAAADGTVYCSPQFEDCLLVIPPHAHTNEQIPLPIGVSSAEAFMGFSGLAFGQDGKLYFSPVFSELEGTAEESPLCEALGISPPFRGEFLWTLIFDPKEQSFSHIITSPSRYSELGADLPIVDFGGIAAAPNGKLYSPPLCGSVVAVLDTAERDFSFISGAGRSSQHNKWTGIASAGDGYMYCAPGRARAVLAIDTNTHALHFIKDDNLFDQSGAVRYIGEYGEALWDFEAGDIHVWSGIALGSNSKLYCSPCDAVNVLVIDPSTWHLSTIDLNDAPGGTPCDLQHKWSGIALADDGRMYCAPWCASSLLVIDPAYDTTAYVEVAAWDPWSEYRAYQWSGIVAARGRIWCSPDNADSILTMLTPRPNLTGMIRVKGHSDLVDVVASDGSRHSCRRSIMVLASDVFSSMLISGLRESQERSISLSCTSGPSVHQFLQYLHSGHLPPASNSIELASLAHMYEMEHLLALCLADVLSSVSPQTVGEAARVLRLCSTATPEASCYWEKFIEMVYRDRRLVCTALEIVACPPPQ